MAVRPPAGAAAVPDESTYIFNTLLFLIGGFLVVWMAAGFAMLKAGLVRAKSVGDIYLKNILLYALACIMFYAMGYTLMYLGADMAELGLEAYPEFGRGSQKFGA